MAKFGDGGELLKCSFCGKSQKQVKKLIAGPGVYICDECIDLCNEIIEEELHETSDATPDRLPKPAELFEEMKVANERIEAEIAGRERWSYIDWFPARLDPAGRPAAASAAAKLRSAHL